METILWYFNGIISTIRAILILIFINPKKHCNRCSSVDMYLYYIFTESNGKKHFDIRCSNGSICIQDI